MGFFKARQWNGKQKKKGKKDKKIKKIGVFERNFEKWGGWR
ncbi:MAG: hypothetical protein NTX52_01885 [Planctomycetota bacterium]|nr:hypothetical protein [Planctomycetota bacterium]